MPLLDEHRECSNHRISTMNRKNIVLKEGKTKIYEDKCFG